MLLDGAGPGVELMRTFSVATAPVQSIPVSASLGSTISPYRLPELAAAQRSRSHRRSNDLLGQRTRSSTLHRQTPVARGPQPAFVDAARVQRPLCRQRICTAQYDPFARSRRKDDRLIRLAAARQQHRLAVNAGMDHNRIARPRGVSRLLDRTERLLCRAGIRGRTRKRYMVFGGEQSGRTGWLRSTPGQSVHQSLQNCIKLLSRGQTEFYP